MKNSNVRRRASWMILSFMLAAGGCGDDSTGNGNGNGNGNGTGTGNGNGNGTTPVMTNMVNVVDFAFDPPDIEVAGGTTVTWTWTGSALHTVTFASSLITSSGASQSSGTHQAVMPTAAGTYGYQCTVHPSTMNGTVLVP